MELEKKNERPRVEIRRKEERIIWLERMLFGSKRDKAPKPSSPNEPTLFDDFFEKACDEKDKAIEKAKEQIEKEAQARRSRKPAKTKRPSEYRYAGLEERWHTEMPNAYNDPLSWAERTISSVMMTKRLRTMLYFTRCLNPAMSCS